MLDAVRSNFEEEQFLQTRIQHFLSQYSSEKSIEEAKLKIWTLKNSLEQLQTLSDKFKFLNPSFNDQHEKLDIELMSRIGTRFKDECNETTGRSKSDLLYLGRWLFIKQFLEDRISFDPLLAAICQKMERNVY